MSIRVSKKNNDSNRPKRCTFLSKEFVGTNFGKKDGPHEMDFELDGAASCNQMETDGQMDYMLCKQKESMVRCIDE
jgi:hypothetical protein